MNKRRVGVVLCLITLATVALTFGSQATKKQWVEQSEANAATTLPPVYSSQNSGSVSQQEQTVPQQVVYGVMFRKIAAFRKKADEKDKKGEDGSALQNYHKHKARLNDQQASALDKITDEVNRETDKLDTKAKKIIKADRARHPGGLLKMGELPPPPPDELKTLGQQRKNLILQGRERLRLALGDAEFQRFDQFVQQDIGKSIKPVKPGDRHPSKTLPQAGGN